MSGNTTQLGIGLTRLDIGLVRLPAILLVCFVLGAFAGTLVYSLSGRWHVPAILLSEGLLLAFALACSFLHSPILSATELLAIAMGMQNAALRSDTGQRIGGTFVTGTVFGLGEKLALWCLGQGSGAPALRDALGWSALALGAAAGTWAFAVHGLLALAVPAACVLSSAAVTGLMTLCAQIGTSTDERPDEPR
ncbi:MAG: DUF1275 domain-containing protein [Methylobacteriaceae bacterium]|nr:DUF1275 domain-containing protein [Methylobacteriaceae bacterium]